MLPVKLGKNVGPGHQAPSQAEERRQRLIETATGIGMFECSFSTLVFEDVKVIETLPSDKKLHIAATTERVKAHRSKWAGYWVPKNVVPRIASVIIMSESVSKKRLREVERRPFEN